jgi:protein-S-isoprenylcysteine O-methyltransferase Ste14
MNNSQRRIAILLLHVIAVLLPMLLGWGMYDWRGFLAEPARAALFAAILAGAVMLLLLKMDLNPLRNGHESDSAQGKLLLMLLIASLGLLVWLSRADRVGIAVFHSALVRWLGLGMCVIGAAIRVLALRRLGPQFSAYVTLQHRHRLIKRGIYGRIRHPLYLSLLLAGPGVALVFRSHLVWPILFVALVFIVDRIRREEALLASHFGASFSRYRARTWALLPRIY